MLARSDRSRGLRFIGIDARLVEGQVSGLRLRSGQVRSELMNINLAEIGAAVACHEQLQSDLANKATLAICAVTSDPSRWCWPLPTVLLDRPGPRRGTGRRGEEDRRAATAVDGPRG